MHIVSTLSAYELGGYLATLHVLYVLKPLILSNIFELSSLSFQCDILMQPMKHYPFIVKLVKGGSSHTKHNLSILWPRPKEESIYNVSCCVYNLMEQDRYNKLKLNLHHG